MTTGPMPPVHVLWPNFYDETMVSYTVKCLVKGMVDEGVDARLYAYSSARTPLALQPVNALPRLGVQYTRHLMPDPVKAVFRRALPKVQAGDVAYVWLDTDPEHARALKARGARLVREMINCTQAFRRAVLTAAHVASGLNGFDGIPDDEIERERAFLLQCDAVFCPNRHVLESVLRYGVPRERCIPASYGWERTRIRANPPRAESGPVNFLFAGSGDIRKGLPLILRAWAAARVDATLTLAGNVTDFVRREFAKVLARPDVRCLGHVDDIDRVYAASDVFLFPSWEEGGPQVTFEAMASGLIPITTDIGSGGAFADGEDLGFIVQPGDVEALVEAIRFCATDRAWLAGRRAAVTERAERYEYTRVSRERLAALRSVLGV